MFSFSLLKIAASMLVVYGDQFQGVPYSQVKLVYSKAIYETLFADPAIPVIYLYSYKCIDPNKTKYIS